MTIRRHIKQGRLKAIKVGRRIRVQREEVERFIRDAEPASGPIVPPLTYPSEEEIARRRRLFADVMRLRDEIGPVGVSVTDLIHEGRAEEDAQYA
jgi:hypothetical protein